MKTIGFDFGTTNSLVSQIQAGRAVSGLDLLNRPTPSAIAYGPGGLICGHAALQPEAGSDQHLIRSPKRCLITGNLVFAGKEYAVLDILADSIRHILKEAANSPRKLELAKAEDAVVTIPVTLAGWQRALLRAAFAAAGLAVRQFLYEPFAAIYAFFRSDPEAAARFAGKPVLVVDWGGGTLDLTLCRLMGNRVTQIASAGLDDVGGDAIDEIIANHALARVLEATRLSAPREAPGARQALLAECESAKISLSTREQAIIYVPEFFTGLDDNALEFALTREKLVELCGPVFSKAFALIDSLINSAGVAREQIGLCLCIGGMVRMPAIHTDLAAIFGPERARIPRDCSTLVAEGAAWFAHDNAELMLAKNIEVELARGNYFRLLKAGSNLPSCGQAGKERFVKLYCTDPRDGQAKIMICQPYAPGRPFPSEPRQGLDLLSVQVDDRARPYFEEISLKYNIDQNLILHLAAVSGHVGDSDETEIHNLEFAVDLPASGQLVEADVAETAAEEEARADGSLRLRSNVVDAARYGFEYYIPGDLLYQLRPDLFDIRNDDLPLIQREERNYGYLKCALCGRKLHDPHCQCRL